MLKKKLKENLIIFYIYNKITEFCHEYFISSERAIKSEFRKRLGREPNLINPVLFTDKLQWLKLNWYDERATVFADKYRVRKFVSKSIGSEYLNELYGVYNRVDEIDISKLPKSFVLKGTHGSGFNIICSDKDKINWKQAKKTMKKWLLTNYYYKKREWVYKDIKPRIICEKYLSDKNTPDKGIPDYKFYCFNGVPHYCQVIKNRGTNETIDFFNMEWEHMPFTGMRLLPNSKVKIEKPGKFEEMKVLASKLSEGFPFVRVDFYYVNKQIIFGEMTFFPTSGMGRFDPPEWDRKLGELLKLPY